MHMTFDVSTIENTVQQSIVSNLYFFLLKKNLRCHLSPTFLPIIPSSNLSPTPNRFIDFSRRVRYPTNLLSKLIYTTWIYLNRFLSAKSDQRLLYLITFIWAPIYYLNQFIPHRSILTDFYLPNQINLCYI